MSMLISYTNTATSPATGARVVNPDPINFAADWRVLTESANEVTFANINAPLDQPETIRVAFSEIADVFKGTKIAPNLMANKAGVSVLVQLTGAGEDNADNTGNYPYSAHLVLKIPTGCSPTVEYIKIIIARLLGTLYGTKETTMDTRINALLRGALSPSDL